MKLRGEHARVSPTQERRRGNGQLTSAAKRSILPGILLDAGLIVLSWTLVVLLDHIGLFGSLRRFVGTRPLSTYVPLTLACALLGTLFLVLSGSYTQPRGPLGVEENRRVLMSMFWLGIALAIASFFFRWDLSRLILLSGLLTASGVLILRRLITGHWRFRQMTEGRFGEPVVLYGAGSCARRIARSLLLDPMMGLIPVAFFDPKSSDADRRALLLSRPHYEVPVYGQDRTLLDIVDRHASERVFICMSEGGVAESTIAVEDCDEAEVYWALVPPVGGRIETYHVENVYGIPILVPKWPNAPKGTRILKRAGDMFISVCIMVASLPVQAVVALLVLRIDGRPVLFRQKRVGRWGRRFEILKFRTMTEGDPQGDNGEAGPRVTRLGKFLRKSSLDELPQLWNVMRGDMSLVGPRPEMIQIVKDYDPVERMRLQVRPGLTGLWQISGDRSRPIHENVDYDLYYIRNQSFLLDMVILLRTALSMHRGD